MPSCPPAGRPPRAVLAAALLLLVPWTGCTTPSPDDEARAQLFEPGPSLDPAHTGTAGHLDGDDRVDLALANGTQVRLLQGQASGDFEPRDRPVYEACTGCRVLAVEAGDLDRDNRTDLVLLVEDRGLVVLPGTDDGFGDPQQSIEELQGPRALALADVHNDGWLDALVATEQGLLRANNTNGTLGSAEAVFDSPVRSFALFFLDGDMALDILATGPERMGLLQNGAPENGTFEPLDDGLPSLEHTSWATVAPTDRDNDQRVDLVLAGQGGLTILDNDGQGRLEIADTGSTAPDGELRAAVPGDVDNDGWEDVVTLTEEGVGVLRNVNGTGLEEIRSAADGPTGTVLGLLDRDRDGGLDPLVLSAETSRWLDSTSREGHAFQMRLKGNTSNPTGTGVKVTLTSGTELQLRQTGGLGTTQAFRSPNPHFGLGTEPASEYATAILWPSGTLQFERTPAERVVDSYLVAFESESRAPWAEC